MSFKNLTRGHWVKSLKIGQSDIVSSALIMGTSQAGKTHWVGIEDEEIIAAIHAGLEAGVTAFDTAEQYGDGYSEQILGKALEGRRNHVAIFSKVFPTNLKYHSVLTACEQSLKNLKTDYLDLYQIHWPSGSWKSENVPLEETLEALCHLKEQGKIRAIGVSNFSLSQLQHACKLCVVDSIQPPYSLFWRYIENEIYPYCIANQISVLSYAPLSQGFLTGKFRSGHQFLKGDHRALNQLYSKEIFPTVLSSLNGLEQFALKKGLTLSQLALAWILNHPNIGGVVGVRNSHQIVENAQAGNIALTEAEMDKISALAWPVASQFMDSSLIWTFSV